MEERSKEDTRSLLIRAGIIRQAHAGLYHLLPLGLRIQEKIERLIDRYMRGLGASKVSLSSLSSESLWQKSGRLADKSELFRLEDRKGAKYLLSPTHEEEITSLVGDIVSSYKELPLRLYQVTRKYRDELRPRGGLLRSREFLMKDLYTFDHTTDSALTTYHAVREAYSAFFREFKVPFLVAEADSGNIGGDLSHEFHFPATNGEDNIVSCDRCSYVSNEEKATKRPDPSSSEPDNNAVTVGDGCPRCDHGSLQVQPAIEIGHTFFLGTRYSDLLDARIMTPTAGTAPEPIQMGCHGIGISRMIAAVPEMLADEKGLRWPKVMAPFEVVIVPAAGNEDDAQSLYDTLNLAGTVGSEPENTIDAIIDNRQKEFVWKLKDADLVGYPIIVVLGRAWAKDRRCEVQCRALGIKKVEIDKEDVLETVSGLLARL
ncbi:hypothetical protein MMC25_001758 [Agyrium rufum]|nr:hypothetical protein [Agyrium rufum]